MKYLSWIVAAILGLTACGSAMPRQLVPDPTVETRWSKEYPGIHRQTVYHKGKTFVVSRGSQGIVVAAAEIRESTLFLMLTVRNIGTQAWDFNPDDPNQVRLLRAAHFDKSWQEHPVYQADAFIADLRSDLAWRTFLGGMLVATATAATLAASRYSETTVAEAGAVVTTGVATKKALVVQQAAAGARVMHHEQGLDPTAGLVVAAAGTTMVAQRQQSGEQAIQNLDVQLLRRETLSPGEQVTGLLVAPPVRATVILSVIIGAEEHIFYLIPALWLSSQDGVPPAL